MLPSHPKKMHSPLARACCFAQARRVIKGWSRVLSRVGLPQGADCLGNSLGCFPAPAL